MENRKERKKVKVVANGKKIMLKDNGKNTYIVKRKEIQKRKRVNGITKKEGNKKVKMVEKGRKSY